MRDKVKQQKNSFKKRWIIGALVIILASVVWLLVESFAILNVTVEYNKMAKKYNDAVEIYNKGLENCCIDNIEGMPLELGLLKYEDENFSKALKVLFSSNSKKKIKKDIQTIQEWVGNVEQWNKIVEQITEPSEEWVMNQLLLVSDISEMQAVTENNNPDGLLNKVNGYKACVYFTLDSIDPNDVAGEDIVAKGTDAGGAIEVYSTVEEAMNRCDYLSGFDGTILYSGSYAIVGTMVVRTSYMLSGESQVYLTDEIVKAFTILE